MCAVAGHPRVLLADDHVLIREGLKAILEQAGLQVVAECSDGLAALQRCETLHPDVAVLDVAMPLLNGIDCARELARSAAGPQVILLTMHADEPYVLAGLRAGVVGYVLKSDAASQLIQAITSVCRGETYLSPGISGAVVQAAVANAPTTDDPLSSRERQVLQLVAEGKNMKEIGGLLGISGRTAETHRTRLMNKLNIHDVPGLVRYAMAHGLVGMAMQPRPEVRVEDAAAAVTAPATLPPAVSIGRARERGPAPAA